MYSLLDDCFAIFIDRGISLQVGEDDDVINNFMAIKKRRPNKKIALYYFLNYNY